MKYTYKKVLQGNYGYGWDDLCTYEAKSNGLAISLKEIKDDYKSYRENEKQYSHRVIFRRAKNA